MTAKQWIGWTLGPILFLITLMVPSPTGMEPEAWRVSGLGLLMATWWITEVLPIPITSLLPIPLIPLLGTGTVEAAAAPFANPIIFLFMGGFMIAKAIERWGLHRRIALAIILRAGTRRARLVAGFMAATAFLSMWVSNTAVAVMMLPIGLSVIRVVRAEEPESENGARPLGATRDTEPPGDSFDVALLLGIAYAASIGGVATLIGTPPNALLAGFMAEEYAIELGFAQWMLVGLPMTLILLPLTWFLLTRVLFDVGSDQEGSGSSATLMGLKRELGLIRSPERRVAWVFGLTAVAWIARPLLNNWIPGLTDAGIAMIATLVLCSLPAGSDERGPLLDWEWARKIPWGILLLFGGGLSLAGAITRSGLAIWIGEALTVAGTMPFAVLLIVVAASIVFLTELTSNTATTAAFLPILAGLAVSLGHDPLLFSVIAALAASCAFMLPVATPPNAVVFGSGAIRMGQMVKAGFLLNLVVIGLTPLLAYLALQAFFG